MPFLSHPLNVDIPKVVLASLFHPTVPMLTVWQDTYVTFMSSYDTSLDL